MTGPKCRLCRREGVQLFLKGDRTSALRAYDRCATVIHGEFGVVPEAETEALVAEIRAGRGSLSFSKRRFRR